MTAVSHVTRLKQLVAEEPDRVAVAVHDGTSVQRVTRAQLLANTARFAGELRSRGVRSGDIVVVALPNGVEHFVASLATWALGACVLPLSGSLPLGERDAVVALAEARTVVEELAFDPEARDDGTRLSDIIAQPGKAIGSGGSTGRPKIIVDPAPWGREPDEPSAFFRELGLRNGQVQLVGAGLYHNTPFGWSHLGLFHGHTLVVMRRFDADLALRLIEQERVEFAAAVPTMLTRMARSAAFGSSDLSSLETVLHTAAPCPAWVKQAWIDKIGGPRVVEAYGASDYIGACVIRGDEWLTHQGSVGRPVDCDVKVLDDAGAEVPSGTVGHVYLRRWEQAPAYAYVGAEPLPTTPDGFSTVGDLGHVDAEGFLYLADRRTDLIISGGANVYPAEVEAVLSRHELVFDNAVIGLPDDDWGQRVHAVVQLVPGSPEPAEAEPALHAHCREHLPGAKRPKTFEFVRELPRNDAGKLRRSALVATRTEGTT